MSHAPKIFISATSADLHSMRELVRKALLTINCHPIDQETFETDWRTVKEMLPAKIESCQALLHIAGLRYGAEPDPSTRPSNEPRRSYTQMEYDIGRRLQSERGDDHFRVYTFVLPETFPYDQTDSQGRPVPPESDDRRELQRAHRAALLENEHLRYKPDDVAALRAYVLSLQEQVLSLIREQHDVRTEVVRTRRIGLRFVVAGFVALVAIAAGIAFYQHRIALQQTRTEKKQASDNAALINSQEAILNEIAAFRAELAKPAAATAAVNAVPDESFALPRTGSTGDSSLMRQEKAAAAKGISVAELRTQLAAEGADVQQLTAAVAARRRAVQVEAEEWSDLERRAQQKLGESELARGRYAEAVAAFSASLALAARPQHVDDWATLQAQLGRAYTYWEKHSTGSDIAQLRSKAIDAYRSALAVASVDSPQTYAAWTMAQCMIAHELGSQAAISSGAERLRLLTEAIPAYRIAVKIFDLVPGTPSGPVARHELATTIRELVEMTNGNDRLNLLGEALEAEHVALKFFSREKFPEAWAKIQNEIGFILRREADISTGANRLRLLGEAVVCHRAALEIVTRATSPQEWAWMQTYLANTLGDQADASSGSERTRLFDEAIGAYRSILEIHTRESMPVEWAKLQNNLGNALIDQSSRHPPDNRSRLLGNAVTAFRNTLDVFDLEHSPQEWARIQTVIANTLSDQSLVTTGADQDRLFNEAVQAYQSALSIRTRDAYPQDWTRTQSKFAIALRAQAESRQEPDRTQLLNEAIIAMKSCLEVKTAGFDPEYYAQRAAWIGEIEAELRKIKGDNTKSTKSEKL